MYAIKTDGTLWGWGCVPLGDGTEFYSNVPVKIMDDVRTVSAGQGFSMAIKTDGSLWTWGKNSNEYVWGFRGGFLGDGTIEDRLLPVKIMEDVAYVSAGAFNCMAIKTDGTLYVWGENVDGTIGDGTMMDRHCPVEIMSDVDMGFMAGFYAMAVKKDGSLWGWGSIRGECKLKPFLVNGIDDVATVSMGSYYTNMAIKGDGSLWIWGADVGRFDSEGTGWSIIPRQIILGGPDEEIQSGDDVWYSTDKSVFDFEIVLEMEDFPYGTTTINQLISKFGAVEYVEGRYYAGYETGIVYVEAEIGELTFSFSGKIANDFSFSEEAALKAPNDGEWPDDYDNSYRLNENDRNIELNVQAVRIKNEKYKLPFGLKIGQSSMADIIAAYGEKPVAEYRNEELGYDAIIYSYAFMDQSRGQSTILDEIGGVTYSIDRNDVLVEVSIDYWYDYGC